MAELDVYLDRLLDGIYRLGLLSCVNVMIVSDHGQCDLLTLKYATFTYEYHTLLLLEPHILYIFV